MSEEKTVTLDCCGCIPVVIFILFIWLMFFGLPMPGGHKYNIDIFPPRIWDMNEGRTMEAGPALPQPERPTNGG